MILLKPFNKASISGKLEITEENYIFSGTFTLEPKLKIVSGLLTIYMPPYIKEEGFIQQDMLEMDIETDPETFQEVINFLESGEFKHLWEEENKKAIEETINSILGKKKISPWFRIGG
jgi:hypothetical protein